MAISAAAAGTINEPKGGVRLFAASARNLGPRLISNIAVAAVGWIYVGPVWTALWFVSVWAIVFAGLGLMALIKAQSSKRAAARLSLCLTFNSVVISTLTAIMPAALWARADDAGRAFALITLFVAAAYVLLHYYSELRTFVALMTPYVAVLAYIGIDLASSGGRGSSMAIVLAAGAASLLNFFYLS
ncbi:MAG: hypothetical protein ACYC8V_01385, partial [Caulobacteraceae bacterium]